MADLGRRALLAIVAAFALLTILRAPGAAVFVWAGLAVLTAIAPFTGLLMVAGLVPLGAALGSLSGGAAWTEPLVVAFLAGAAARAAAHPRAASWTIPIPAVVLAVAVIASASTQLAVGRVRTGPGPFLDEMSRLLAGRYFSMLPELGALTTAALFLEGLGLFAVATVMVRQSAGRLPQLANMMVAGAAGAAALNASRLLTASLATGEGWSGLARLARGTRISVEYGDVNAAGSYFAMLLCLALGVTVLATRWRRLPAAGGVVLIALALWLTSSRAAILSILAIATMAIVLSVIRPRRGRMALSTLLGAGGVALATVVVLLFLPNRLIGGNATAAAGIRRDMAVVSARLFASHPLFGIGIGEFYEQSGDEMLRLPVSRIYIRQNAHNNFLQILAELGLAGFACFALILWSAARGLWTAHRREPDGALLIRAVAAALAAFLLSALFGHPLLTPACAYAFWLIAGAAASFDPGTISGRPVRYLAIAACAILVASAPVRARDAIASADLDHLGYGLSLWAAAEDGQRYRVAAGPATIFIPSEAAVVRVPLRTSGGASMRPVDVRLHGKLVDRLQIGAASWTWYKFAVPERETSRFVPLELEIAGPHAESLHIGKVFVVQERTR